MATESIEKRAERYADNSGFRSDREWRSVKHCCFEIATEQDTIARNEERERCIKAAQEWYCIRCCDTSGEECHYCHIKEHVRKAMEGDRE